MHVKAYLFKFQIQILHRTFNTQYKSQSGMSKQYVDMREDECFCTLQLSDKAQVGEEISHSMHGNTRREIITLQTWALVRLIII